jgi:hypothetical protein
MSEINRQNNNVDYLLFLTPLMSVFIWLVFFYKSEMGMRGYEITVFIGNDYYDDLASLCPGMPSCLRVGAGIFKLGLKFLMEIPFTLLNVPYDKAQMNVISGFATSFISLSSAIYFLYKREHVIVTILMSLLFVLTPFFLDVKIGFVHYDYFVLLFWGVVVTFFIPKKEINFLIYAFYCVIGSLVMENTGIALWVGLILFFFATNLNKDGLVKSLLKYFFILMCPILTTLLVYFGAYINNGNSLHWIREGGNLILAYQMYGINNSFTQIFYSLLKMIWLPFSGIVLLCLYKIYLSKISKKLYLIIKENTNLIWSICCFVGFLSTLVIGKFVSGLSMEWPRQMIPATYLLTMVLINFFGALMEEKSLKQQKEH